MTKKVCVITAARSEYGLLRRTIQALKHDPDLLLQLVVTGSHLAPEYGLTYTQIEKDGFNIDRKVEFLLSTRTSEGIAKSMGVCAMSFADTFSDLQPDLIVVLGDRYELLPICNTALIMGIPIAHISGGDVTEGAIDNQIRNAITMMADLHFPGTESSAENIIRMIGHSREVYCVGEPGLDNFREYSLMQRQELAESLNLEFNKRWILVTLHPETKCSVGQSMFMASKMMEALNSISETEIILTQANADLGGSDMNAYYQECEKLSPNVHYFQSLGQIRYLSVMNEAWCIVGNSSSGLVEAPFIGKRVINIGDRQKGRHICRNVVNVPQYNENQIQYAISHLDTVSTDPDYYYGDGHSSERILKIIKDYFVSAR